MNNVLSIKTDSGNYVDINVIDIVESMNKKYIVFSLKDDDMNDMYVSILNEDDKTREYSIESITDKEELRSIEEFLWDINSKEAVNYG